MVRPDEIYCTSRAAVCEQLTRLLLGTSPSKLCDDSLAESSPLKRERALTLLVKVASHESIDLLRQLLLDDDEEPAVRRTAFLELFRLRAALPAAELEALHANPPQPESPHFFNFDSVFLRMCRSEEALQVARQYLEGKSARERADVLCDLPSNSDREESWHYVPPVLQDWLYDLWLNQDRVELEDVQIRRGRLNLEIACSTRYRQESRALLREYWHGATRKERRRVIQSLQPMMDVDPDYWPLDGDEALLRELLEPYAASDPVGFRQIVEALELPLPFLLERLEPDHLLQMIEQKIESTDTCSEGGGRADRRSDIRQACDLLRIWPDATMNELVAAKMLSPNLSVRVREHYFWVLLKRDHARTREIVLHLAVNDGDAALARILVERTPYFASSADRDLLLWATTDTDPECRQNAIRGLVALGVGGAFGLERLQDLSWDPDPRVRLSAAAALLRMGDVSRLSEIERAAAGATDTALLASALAILGELDASQHFDLFRRTLLERGPGVGTKSSSPAGRAAAALARLGTQESMTALLHAYLTGITDPYQVRELAAFVQSLDGEN